MNPKDGEALGPVERAADAFLGHPAVGDRADELPPALLRGLREVWDIVGAQADAPEIRVLREQALARARRASIRRWRIPIDDRRRTWRCAAAIAGVAILAGAGWQLSPYGLRSGTYCTDIGEQRIVELDDQSRLILDAGTQLRVHFSDDARIVDLASGQAQFVVAPDRSRPFKVRVQGHTFIALGTVFNVDCAGDAVSLVMLEGRVALADSDLEMVAGQGVRIPKDGTPLFLERVDRETATAWRQGKVVFHDEALARAVQRMNRYSRLQLQVTGGELAALKVSGVFDAGDTRGFLEMAQAYLPVRVEHARRDLIRLREVR